ncbi:MAG: hypothetical protein WCT04_17460 [Planctomycetota bacterium]
MANTPLLLTGPAKDWLVARRDELNARFRTAKRRFPRLDAQSILALNAEFLPPLAGFGEPGTDELLSEIFDLIILHAGRGLLSLGPSPMRVLFSEALPILREHLLQRPRALPSALSNAVENLREKGVAFSRTLAAMAGDITDPDQIRDAGALTAWRLGEARLREQALNSAARLPGRAALIALGLDHWPASTAPLALAALIGDAWCHPRERISPRTLTALSNAPRETILAALEKLSAPFNAQPLACRMSATCGEFAGFGGPFLEPPKLLYVGKNTHRHHFWVRSGTENFRIDADIFGWVCRPDPSADFPVQDAAQRMGVGAMLFNKLKGLDTPALYNDGALFSNGTVESIPELRDASSYCIIGDLLAATGRDSFRIRIFSPARPAI